MSMVRRLFPEMRSMLRLMDEAFPSLLRRPLPLNWPEATSGSVMPAADLSEQENKYIIEAEMPGVQQSDIRFEQPNENTIMIRAEVRRGEHSSSTEGERFYGVMERAFTVPSRIDPDQVRAELKDGILKIEIPKKEEAKKELQISWKSSDESK